MELGTFFHLEKFLAHNYNWVVCQIHSNELPIIHLIKKVDGPTSSNEGFTGEFPLLLHSVEKMEYYEDFSPITKVEGRTQVWRHELQISSHPREQD